MKTKLVLSLALSAVASMLPARATHPVPDCTPTHAARWKPATGAADPNGAVRVVAIQYKQDVRFVESYETFRHKMECLIHDFVPGIDEHEPHPPTIVVFNEDIGLATLATGSRGAAARAIANGPVKDPANIPGAIAAFATVGAGYARQVGYYTAKFPDTSPQRLILAAATDTFARGFMKTFSDLARRFGVYVVAANNQAEFKVTTDPVALAALADPDLASQYADGSLSSVYEAVDVPGTSGAGRAGIDIHNTAYMWSPDPGVTPYADRRFAPYNGAPLTPDDPRANIVAVNTKTPLTSIEQEILDLSDGNDMSEANTGPFCFDAACTVKIGFGISLPAFKWGTAYGVPFEGDPCASSATWMRCLDARGVNLLLQPEANSGMWAEYIDQGWKPPAFQSLSWLDSAWRAVADPTVKNIRYAVTPFMVGNLVDLTFDGQSAIFERCLPRAGDDTCGGNVARTHVGANEFNTCGPYDSRCDDPALEPYAFEKRETLVMADWVAADCPLCLGPIANRERLASVSRAMQAGSGSPEENNYLETAVWADLAFD